MWGTRALAAAHWSGDQNTQRLSKRRRRTHWCTQTRVNHADGLASAAHDDQCRQATSRVS